MKKKIKVLHLLQSSHFSGAENVVIQIIDMVDKDLIEMTYCSPEGPIGDTLKEKGIIYHPISNLSVKEVKRVITQYQPDIIHAHDAYASVIAASIGRGITIISHMHGNHEDLRKLGAKSVLYFLFAYRFRHIFWVSKSAYENYLFKRVISSKSSILYNVLDKNNVIQKKNQDNKNYKYDIVYVGRLTYPKNPERLIKIFQLVIKRLPGSKIAFIGTGDLLEQTKQSAIDLGLSKNIDFLGFQKNPLKIMEDAKVMVMASRYEGTPMCALEAMIVGLPIVSTPTDGMKELVTHGETGFLSEDDNELANHIVQIVENNSLYLYLSSKTKQDALRLNNINSYYQKLRKAYFIN